MTKHPTRSGHLDGQTRLEYNRPRYYDPKVGRWIEQDPLGFDAGDANLYRYVSNDPINAIDAAGLDDKGLLDSTFKNFTDLDPRKTKTPTSVPRFYDVNLQFTFGTLFARNKYGGGTVNLGAGIKGAVLVALANLKVTGNGSEGRTIETQKDGIAIAYVGDKPADMYWIQTWWYEAKAFKGGTFKQFAPGAYSYPSTAGDAELTTQPDDPTKRIYSVDSVGSEPDYLSGNAFGGYARGGVIIFDSPQFPAQVAKDICRDYNLGLDPTKGDYLQVIMHFQTYLVYKPSQKAVYRVDWTATGKYDTRSNPKVVYDVVGGGANDLAFGTLQQRAIQKRWPRQDFIKFR
jgi:RHS repeat-associated protein